MDVPEAAEFVHYRHDVARQMREVGFAPDRRITVLEGIELAGEIVPGITFHLLSITKSGICTLYSRNLEQGNNCRLGETRITLS